MHGLALAALRLVAVDHGQHIHAQGLTLGAHQLADPAIADDAHSLAGELKALGVGFLLPLVLPHGVARDGDVPGTGEQQGQSQFRHRVGGGAGRVLHLDAVFLCVFDCDVVYTDAGPDDELQAAACGGVDLRLLDLGGAADDNHVEVPQGCAQLIGLIELLDDFISILAQLFHCASIHPIGNQNS